MFSYHFKSHQYSSCSISSHVGHQLRILFGCRLLAAFCIAHLLAGPRRPGSGAVRRGRWGRLRHVLLGQSPGGETLTARPGLRRRHGWDLVFAAPKSLSLLAAPGLRATPPSCAAPPPGRHGHRCHHRGEGGLGPPGRGPGPRPRGGGRLRAPRQRRRPPSPPRPRGPGQPGPRRRRQVELSGGRRALALAGGPRRRLPAGPTGTPGRGRVRLHVGDLQWGPGRDHHRSAGRLGRRKHPVPGCPSRRPFVRVRLAGQ